MSRLLSFLEGYDKGTVAMSSVVSGFKQDCVLELKDLLLKYVDLQSEQNNHMESYEDLCQRIEDVLEGMVAFLSVSARPLAFCLFG